MENTDEYYEYQGGSMVLLTSPDGMFPVLVHKGSSDYKPLTKADFVDLGPSKREEQIEAMMPDDPFEYLDNLKPIPGISKAMKEEIQEKYQFARELTLYLLEVSKHKDALAVSGGTAKNEFAN